MSLIYDDIVDSLVKINKDFLVKIKELLADRHLNYTEYINRLNELLNNKELDNYKNEAYSVSAWLEIIDRGYSTSDRRTIVSLPSRNALKFRANTVHTFNEIYEHTSVNEHYIKTLFDTLSGSVEAVAGMNEYSEFKSYSASLPIALIKYGAQTLSIYSGLTNAITLEIELSLFNELYIVPDKYDTDSETGNQYESLNITLQIPIDDITKIENTAKKLTAEIVDIACSLNHKEVCSWSGLSILGFELEMHRLNYSILSTVRRNHLGKELPSHKSWKTDAESIIYDRVSSDYYKKENYVIHNFNKNETAIIRDYFIIRVCLSCNYNCEIFDDDIAEQYKSIIDESKICEYDKHNLQKYIINYIDNNIEKVRKEVHDLVVHLLDGKSTYNGCECSKWISVFKGDNTVVSSIYNSGYDWNYRYNTYIKFHKLGLLTDDALKLIRAKYER